MGAWVGGRGGGVGKENVFLWYKNNFYRSICLVALAGAVLKECIDEGGGAVSGTCPVLHGGGNELKCVLNPTATADVTILS